ncbi:PD40 domain-containing protein [Microbacterium immunditiarum]|uniref:Uncharacterized protein n=1 Tax=Microbacterium immunditiarum TaxID=337480 RepID=A0A7Y9KN66_9MICO|nr:PD40 domain-containing protein [Microbacterium immunditiarum]NYE21519.1 hypothetical protein [Microbacterium immunditiarum]
MNRITRGAFTVVAVVFAGTMAFAPTAASGLPYGADGGWGEAAAVSGVNAPQADGCPIESPNGQELYIASMRGGPDNDIWVAARVDRAGSFNAPVQLPAPINSATQDFCPTPLADGSLLFVSTRGGVDAYGTAACGGGDIYIVHRVSGPAGWTAPRNLGCAPNGPNTAGWEYGPSLVTTGSTTYLYFSSGANFQQPGSLEDDQDIYASPQIGALAFGPGEPVAELNTEMHDVMPNVGRDGMEIVFASNRVGGPGLFDIYSANRPGSAKGTSGGWSEPVVVSAVSTAGAETRPSLSGDGHRLYFGRDGDIFVSTR